MNLSRFAQWPHVFVQGNFVCVEAHPDLGGSLMVLAIKEGLLSWPDYCKALHVIDPDAENALDNVQPHSAVHAAVAEVIRSDMHAQYNVLLTVLPLGSW